MSVVFKLHATKKIGQPNYSSLEVSCGIEVATDIGVLGDEQRLVQLYRQGYVHAFRAIEEQLSARCVPGTYKSQYDGIATPDVVVTKEVVPLPGHTIPEPVAAAISQTTPATSAPWQSGTFGQAADVPDPIPGPKPVPSPSMTARIPAPSFGLWCKGKCTDYGMTLSQILPGLTRILIPSAQPTSDNRAMGAAITALNLSASQWEKALDELLGAMEPAEAE